MQGSKVGGRDGALWLPAGGIRASQGTFSSFVQNTGSNVAHWKALILKNTGLFQDK